jgi:hypothetical protein
MSTYRFECRNLQLCIFYAFLTHKNSVHLSTCLQSLFLRNQWRHTTIIEWRVVTGSRSLQCVGVTLSLSCACKMLCSRATSNRILVSHLQRNWGLLPFKVLTWNQQKRPGVGPPAAISGFLKMKRSIKNNGWKKYSSYLDPFGSNSEVRHTRLFCIRIESGCKLAVWEEYRCVLLWSLTVTVHWN